MCHPRVPYDQVGREGEGRRKKKEEKEGCPYIKGRGSDVSGHVDRVGRVLSTSARPQGFSVVSRTTLRPSYLSRTEDPLMSFDL